MKTNIFLIVVFLVVALILYLNRDKFKKKPATTTKDEKQPETPVKNVVNPILPDKNDKPQIEPDIRPLTEAEVKLWQSYLKSKGYNLGQTGLLRNGVDGIWGDYTAAATLAEVGKSLINYQEYKFYIAKDLASKLNVDSTIKVFKPAIDPILVDNSNVKPFLVEEPTKQEFFMPDVYIKTTGSELKGAKQPLILS